jgi:hypothetical protein
MGRLIGNGSGRSPDTWREQGNAAWLEWLDLANTEGDFLKRKGYFQEIQEMLIGDVPVV